MLIAVAESRKLGEAVVEKGELVVPSKKPFFESGGIVKGGGEQVPVGLPLRGEFFCNEKEFVNLQKALGKSEDDARKEWDAASKCNLGDS